MPVGRIEPVFRRNRIFRMIISAIAAIFVALALTTLVGTWLIERANPPTGKFVDVDGGRIHYVELGRPDAPAVVLFHGASGNLNDLKVALGDRLASRYRLIFVDRPGHGWSDRPDGNADAEPSRQAELIHQALEKIGVRRPIIFGHSWSGALATAYALAYPQNVSGLVLLSAVTHSWEGGVGFLNDLIATPVIGEIVARTVIMPSGYLMMHPAVNIVFAPQSPPPDYIERTAGRMILRPSEFIANAQDLVALNEAVRRQSPRYGEIKVPTAILGGDIDKIVYTDLHSRSTAAAIDGAKLTILRGIGHMAHYAVPDVIVAAIDDVAARAR